jgi:dethiobiotin synthetase
MRGVFVSATDTEVGKTVVASAIAATLAEQGEHVAVFKPVVTGLGEIAGLPDHELLRRSARSDQPAEAIAPYRFAPPASPHLAAELAGTEVVPGHLVAAAEAAAARADALVVEGVGGLLVPLCGEYLIRDFALELDLPVVVAARPGLGTINHTLLTIESARAAGLVIAAVVFTPWPSFPAAVEASNRRTVEELTGVETFELRRMEVDDRVQAIASLPASRWVRAPQAAAA